MDPAFDKAVRRFFRIAGIVTAAGALPTMLSPVEGFRLTTGLTYFGESPQVFPVIGHWGAMVTGIGVLMFVAATRKELRKATAVYATVEKGYIVGAVLYCYAIGAPFAHAYLLPLVGDAAMVAGGLWYLCRSRQLGRS
jgi:hypothetical protein